MKKGRLKYVVFIIAAVLLMPTAVERAAELRGGFYIGGEWLLVPAAVLICLLIDSIKCIFIELEADEEYEDFNE